MTNTSPTGWAAIASIVRPQGRRGEVLAELLTDLDPDAQFAAGRIVSVAGSGSSKASSTTTPMTLEGHWLPLGKNAGRIVLKLAGCDTISQAELLNGSQVLVPVEDLPALESDAFYVADLLGCTLLNDGEPSGEIVDVHFATSPDGKKRLPDAPPLLCIALPGSPPGAEPILVPFARAHLERVDLAAKRIFMHLPSGLLDGDETGECRSS